MDDPSTVHIVPQDDLREHAEQGGDCWCEPAIKLFEHGRMVIHHSADGRERWEDSRS